MHLLLVLIDHFNMKKNLRVFACKKAGICAKVREGIFAKAQI